MWPWILLLSCVPGVLVFTVRLRNVRRSAPAVRPDVARFDVSIVVPARNEAHNLPTLLASLAALEPAPREILVVDDHSTDATAEIARAHGAHVIEPGPRPPEFLGKPWACLAGARAARGRYLLFTDADTWHAPDSLARSVALLEVTGAGLVSIVPTHRLEALWERLQGVFQLLLLIATRADTRPTRTSVARPFAIGQYLLFRRDAYEAVGGHAATPQRIAEDLALARLVSAAGFGARVLYARGALCVRMYPEGFGAFVAGWRRNFRDGLSAAGLGAMVEMTLVVAWLLGLPLWLGQALATGRLDDALLYALGYLATALLIAREQRGYGAFSRTSALAYPLFALVFVWVTAVALVDAARGRPVTWRGRTFAWVR